mmetsp:Transcript_9482/g.16887  ORF Transcript_9482/g.16887 Transcript_9482/m.16887 type:complete len:357 (+) Transcript_9482:347-1417(+)
MLTAPCLLGCTPSMFKVCKSCIAIKESRRSSFVLSIPAPAFLCIPPSSSPIAKVSVTVELASKPFLLMAPAPVFLCSAPGTFPVSQGRHAVKLLHTAFARVGAAPNLLWLCPRLFWRATVVSWSWRRRPPCRMGRLTASMLVLTAPMLLLRCPRLFPVIEIEVTVKGLAASVKFLTAIRHFLWLPGSFVGCEIFITIEVCRAWLPRRTRGRMWRRRSLAWAPSMLMLAAPLLLCGIPRRCPGSEVEVAVMPNQVVFATLLLVLAAPNLLWRTPELVRILNSPVTLVSSTCSLAIMTAPLLLDSWPCYLPFEEVSVTIKAIRWRRDWRWASNSLVRTAPVLLLLWPSSRVACANIFS